MIIDLKNKENITLNNVIKLLSSKDDSIHRQLRISKDGIAFISDDVSMKNLKDIIYRSEIWTAKSGYLGKNLTNDYRFEERILKDLLENYPIPQDSFVGY